MGCAAAGARATTGVDASGRAREHRRMPKRLTNAIKEDLSDARTLLDTAVHNVQTVLRSDSAEPAQADAVASALGMTEQALKALRRVQDKLGGTAPS